MAKDLIILRNYSIKRIGKGIVEGTLAKIFRWRVRNGHFLAKQKKAKSR